MQSFILNANKIDKVFLKYFGKGVQSAYRGMLEEGRLTQATANILMRSVDEAMDLVSRQPLCDWKGLQSSVQFPSYYRFLQMSRLPRKLITYFTVERLELGCYICAAFLRAHRIARRQLHDFLGDSDVASVVIDESNAEGEEAKKFLEDVRVTFPQVLHVLKTRQVTYSVLTQLSEYIQNLQKTGLLEEKEMIHLDDALQTDLKKLKRNPPLVKMPSVSDVLNTHPLVGALPAAARESLLSNTKETVRGHGTILCREGSRPTGIWLVSIDVIKWTSQRLRSRHSLDLILSHGSTLGLYEVLIGKPYICDMVTDSVVHCFFIESEKIEQLRQSDPSIEIFLWKESAIVIARLLLPQIFKKMAMREIRVLVAERSTMNMYIKDEDIELEQNYIGIFLEGFLKTRSQNLITPPAVLLPSNTDLTLFGLESSAMNHIDYCYTAPCYQVEARARIIFFEIGRVAEADADLQRNASLQSQTPEPPRTLNKEHSGLLPRVPSRPSNTWPLLSVQSEGSNMKRMPVPKEAGEAAAPAPPAPSTSTGRPRPKAVEDGNSSDESAGEEVIVRVETPSMLSFRQSSGAEGK